MARLDGEPVTKGQRAHVTLLFLDICDYTALSELNDPEVADELRRKLERLFSGIIRKHGGVVTQFYGDGTLAVFGLPLPKEDDSRRAVEAALEAHAAVRDVSWDGAAPKGYALRLHSGVHAGLVFVRTGDTLHGRYELTGDTVNLAARLSDAAENDQILVSGTTLRGVEAFFSTESAREIRVKGKLAPVRVSRVTGRTSVRTRFDARRRTGLTPLVGRQEQLDSMDDVLDEARQGEGRLIVIRGVAGIGKTRLLEEFRVRAGESGVRVLSGCCDGYGEAEPLDPFLQILRQAFGFQPDMSAPAAAGCVMTVLSDLGMLEHATVFLRLLSLTSASNAPSAPNVTTLATLRALSAIVERATADKPLALLLDDWQWADETSRSVLRLLCRQFDRQRLCLVVSMRDERRSQVGARPHMLLELSPFSESECKLALGALRSQDLDLHLTAALIERSGGNPLFLEELSHSLPADVVAGQTALESSGIPNTLRGLIQARAARLTSVERETLQLASVVGLEFSAAMLAQVRGAPLDSVLSALASEGLIYTLGSGSTYRFKHGITRDVVYETVRIAERRKLHEAIAGALEAAVASGDLVDHSEQLAFHHRGSDQHARAAQFAELAGDKAAASSFLVPARAHYAAALASLDCLTSTRELTRRWLAINGKWSGLAAYAPTDADLQLIERAVSYAAQIEDRRAQAHNSHMLCWFHYVLGNFTLALAHATHARELAEENNDQKLIMQTWSSIGQVHAAGGDYVQAIPMLDRGIELKRARAKRASTSGGSSAIQYAHTLGVRALVHADLGDFEAALELMGEGLDIVRGTGNAMEPSVLASHALVLMRRGSWSECIKVASAASKAAERVGSMWVFAFCYALEHYARYQLKPAESTFARLRRATNWLEASRFGLYLSIVYVGLADVALASREPSVARDFAERALRRALDGDLHGRIGAHRTLARLASRYADSRAQVEQHFGQAFAFAHALPSPREVALTSLAAAQLGWTPPASMRALGAAQTLQEFERMGMHAFAAQARALVEPATLSSGAS